MSDFRLDEHRQVADCNGAYDRLGRQCVFALRPFGGFYDDRSYPTQCVAFFRYKLVRSAALIFLQVNLTHLGRRLHRR